MSSEVGRYESDVLPRAKTAAGLVAGLITSLWRSKKRQALLGDVVRYILLSVFLGAALLPVIWMVSSSLKSEIEILQFPPVWIPKRLLWSNYVDLFREFDLLMNIRNTLFITAFGIVGNVLSNACVAYGFARLRARGRDLLFALALSTMMLPYQVTMVPLYLVFHTLGWINTFLPLIVPPFFGNAFFIFLLRQFFRTIPDELFDAARIDGCSEFRLLWQIVLPLSKPALVTVAIFSFIGCWNDFLGPLLYLGRRDLETLALVINRLRWLAFWGRPRLNYVMALSSISILPCLLIFLFLQRYYIEGIIAGALKR